MATPELNKALCKCQLELKPAVKDSINPHFKNRYADITSIIEALRDPMASNGLSITQTTRYEGGVLLLITTLRHISGEEVDSVYPIIPVKQDPQGFGSAMTYARRYSIQAMLMVPSDDDDGHQASQPAKPAKKAEDTNHRSHIEAMLNFMHGAGVSEEQVLAKLDKYSVAQITDDDMGFLRQIIQSSKDLKTPIALQFGGK